MSELSPRRRTLESLKKEAKRWLGALHEHEPDASQRFERLLGRSPENAGLRDVQHALAIEHGFAGWTDLKRALSAIEEETAKSINQFDVMAESLLEAFRTGTPEAMKRHWSLTWHRRSHEGMRTYVQLDLGRQVGSEQWDQDITLDDARLLVAREHGFENWNALEKYYRKLQLPASTVTQKPVRTLTSAIDDETTQGWHSRDWQAVLGQLRERRPIGIDAIGQMTDAMLEDISSFEHLQILRLGGSRGVSDEGVRRIARLPNLRSLDLSGTGVTDRALDDLGGFMGLETVSLAWTRITDVGVAKLADCSRLKNVNLQGTATGDGALRALIGKAHLCQLRSGNAVTDAGLACLRDMPAFRRWQGGEPKMGLTSYDADPNYLLLRGSFTDRGMSRLEELAGLFALNLDASELKITADGLAPLVQLPNLGWLAVDATDASMPLIAQMPQLRFLGCQDTTATDAGFTSLSKSTSIEYIWGRRCHNLQAQGFEALANMPSLRGLSVSCKNVADSALAALSRFPALRELMPIDIPDEGYRHIARCQQLESLVLMYCRDTGDAATEHLVALPRLKHYFASYNRISDRTPELLSRMDSLECVTFSDCAGVTEEGLAHLARLPNLRELRVSGPRVSTATLARFPNTVRVYCAE